MKNQSTRISRLTGILLLTSRANAFSNGLSVSLWKNHLGNPDFTLVNKKRYLLPLQSYTASSDVDEQNQQPISTESNKFGLVLPNNDAATNIVESVLLEGAIEDNFEFVSSHSNKDSDVVLYTLSSEEEEGDNTGVRDILRFAIPAVGVWLCGPLLSCIDTAAVGLFSGTTNQAALSPAVAITDYSALLLSFIYAATTNLIAGSSEKRSESNSSTSNTLINSMQISAYCGVLLGTVLLLFSKALVVAMIGGGVDVARSTIGTTALRYVRIRALGMPAAAVIGCTQAACLGMKDIRAPFYVLAAAAVVNFFGDVLFVGHKSAWIGGAAGAAWATVLSQYVALGFFLKWLLYNKPNESNKISNNSIDNGDTIMVKEDLQMSPFQRAQNNVIATKSALRHKLHRKPNPKKKTSFSSKGFLANKFHVRDMLRVPTKYSMQQFAPYVLPVTASSVGRVSMYIAMNYVVSSSLGTAAMAAQQIILSIFYCLCPIADSLNLTAQSFVPPIYSQPTNAPNRLRNLRKLTTDFLKTGTIFGALMCTLVSFIPFISHLFTTDLTVLHTVHSVLPHLMMIFGIHGLVQAGEGVLLGSKDLKFLGNAFTAFFAVVPYAMIYKKRIMGSALSLTGLWQVFVSYQFVRCGLWWSRIWLLQLREKQQKENLPMLRVLDDVGNSMNKVEGYSVSASSPPPDELLVSSNFQ